MSDDDHNSSSSDDDSFLFCDATPHSTVIDLNLVECLTGVSTSYSGTSTMSFHVEEPTSCLFFHLDNTKIKIEKLQLHQGKHVLRPKCVYDMENYIIKPQQQQQQQQQQNLPPFKWVDQKTNHFVEIGPSSKHLENLSVVDLKIVELPAVVSYCTIDIVITFQASLNDEGNGIYCCASRPANTVANGLTLTQPTFFIATQFEVDHAHRSFPCVDFVFIRQTVKFILTVPQNTFCRSNGGGGTTEDLKNFKNVFAQSSSSLKNSNNNSSSIIIKKESLPSSNRPIPFYIAGFIASTLPLIASFETVDFQSLSLANNDDDDDEGNDTQNNLIEDVIEESIEFCVVTTYDSQFMTDLALKSLIDSTKELRQFFHCSVDLPHLWILAAPKLVLGGMENDGFIFLKESLGVTNQSQPGQGRRSVEAATKELVRFIVHEVVHHWIGNRIGFSFAWKEGITLVLERYFGNVLLGLNPNQGSKGGASTSESESATESGKLVQVESGKELSGTTYHKAEAAMEAVVRKLGWKAFQNGVQRMIHELEPGEYIDDKRISSFFKLKKKQ